MTFKILLTLFIFSLFTIQLSAQSKTYQIKADSLRVFSDCDTAELILVNGTRNVADGVLTNKGNGVTEFRKVLVKLNDSTFLVGGDTMLLSKSALGMGNAYWALGGNKAGAVKTIGTTDTFAMAIITSNLER